MTKCNIFVMRIFSFDIPWNDFQNGVKAKLQNIYQVVDLYVFSILTIFYGNILYVLLFEILFSYIIPRTKIKVMTSFPFCGFNIISSLYLKIFTWSFGFSFDVILKWPSKLLHGHPVSYQVQVNFSTFSTLIA